MGVIWCGGAFLSGSRKNSLCGEGKTTLMTNASYVATVCKIGENVIEREHIEKYTYRSQNRKGYLN